MRACIFTTYNYQDGEELIQAQSEQFVESIKGMDIQFWSLRYNLPKRYMSFEQAIDHGMKHLTKEYDIIVFVPVHSVPLSQDVLNSVIEKCKHGFVIVDGDAFATSKENYDKIKQNDVVNEVFTRKVILKKEDVKPTESDPELFNPFGCFLMKHKVPDTIFSQLENVVNETKKQLQNKSFVDENNFEDYLAGKNSYQIKIQPTDELSNYILNLGHHYIQKTNTSFEKIKMGSVWVNYAYRGDFNPIHTHDSLLSGTIYIHQGESVMQEMEKGSNSGRDTSSIPGMTHFVHDLNYHPFNKFSYSNEFVKGELLMFPSWLSHWVNPFRSNDERITIAFNILES